MIKDITKDGDIVGMLLRIFTVVLTTVLSNHDEMVLKDSVDLIEVNHYYDAKCEPVFDQLIFYDWSSQKKAYDVRAWRLIKRDNQIPFKKNGGYMVRWHDDGFLREIISPAIIETHAQYDPELVARENLPQDQRVDLKPIAVSAP